MKHHKGFTLIELLVVVAIIGILATIIITSLSSAQAKARDAKRIQNVKNIQTALEMYYLDYGKYPSTPDLNSNFTYSSVEVPCGPAGGTYGGAWCNLEAILSSYIPSLPRAQREAADREYIYKVKNSTSSHQAYGLGVILETSNHSTAVNDGGYENTMYEVGELTQCGQSWKAWNGTIPACY